MHIEITTRHGTLEPHQQAYLQEKAEKLRKYFGRLMAIEVEADHRKNGWLVEIFVSAEHKHDFVAREEAATPEAAMDQSLHKLEQQLRRYKEKIQNHKGDIPQGGMPPVGDVALAGEAPEPADLPTEPPAPERRQGPRAG